MALDVTIIAPPRDGSKKPYRRHAAALHGDGYWQFLSDHWPASSSTGRLVDLYDDTYFAGANLPQLRTGLLRARMVAASRPSEWREFLGTQIEPTKEEDLRECQA